MYCMDSKNMTGEPNQQNPTSVFGFDAYPPPFPVNWNQSNPFATTNSQYNVPINQSSQIFTQNPGFNPLSSVSIPTMPNVPVASPYNYFDQQLSGFSFGTPKQTQEVVQFPFEPCSSRFGTRDFRCKRKTDSPPLQPAKQHITEEKMAEHMSNLHISSETVSPKETSTTRMQRLYMCEEMRKLQTDTILPQSLLSRIQGPCTALVLWKPPTKLIPFLDSKGGEESSKKSNNSKREGAETTNEDEMVEEIYNDMDLDAC